jgi:iron complex outermembrane recepter protein
MIDREHTHLRLQRKPLALAVGCAIALGMVALLDSPVARAQGAGLEEIIVTAQKREENIMDIPATVNALTAEQIGKFRVVSMDDLQSMTPGLLTTRNDARRQSVTIRGITADPDNNAAAPISMYWNEAPIRTQAAFATFFDLERIEVLRGPQGTLQGRTDPAGAIILHTKKPDLEALEGTLRQSFSDNDGMQTEFGVSVPIVSDVFGVRISGLWDQNDGAEYENIFNGQDESHETASWRISAEWRPLEQARISFVHEHSELDFEVPEAVQGDVGGVIAGITAARNGASAAFDGMLARINDADPSNDPAFAQAAAVLIPSNIARRAVVPTWLDGLQLSADDRQAITRGESQLDMRSENTLLRMSWDFENHTLTSISSLRDWYQNNWGDINYGNLAPLGTLQNTRSEAEDWSQEIRLSSNDNAFWNYTVGMFWEDFDGLTNNYTDLAGPFSIYGAMAGLANGDMVQHLVIPNGRETLAFFAHNRFELTDATTLQLGLRWQEIDNEQVVRAALINNYNPAPEAGPITNPAFAALNPRLTSAGVAGIFAAGVRTGDYIPNELQTVEEREVTGSIKLSHTLANEDMVYLSLDRSFRPSGATITPAPLTSDTLLFDGENSDSLELGYKGMAFDDLLRFSASAFYQEYSNYQPKASTVNALVQQGLTRVPQLIQGGVVFNADAVIKGIELEFSAAPAENFQVGGGLSYTEATFEDGELGPCNRPFTPEELADPAVEVATCDIGGEDVSSQPDWSANLNAEYSLATSVGEVFVRPLLSYVGEREDRLTPLQKFDDYVLVNLYAGLRSDDGRWEATLWVKNLTDEDTDNVFSVPAAHAIGGISNFTRAVLIPPRLLGGTFTYNFGI